MPIEEIDLGLQPKVVEGDDGVYNASLVPSKEWVATGKEVHDPEFARLLDDTTEQSDSESERKESIFGMERISAPDGGTARVRGDKVPFYKTHGYGVRPRTTRMLVPDLPWHTKGIQTQGFKRTLIRYRDGRRFVYVNGQLQIERGDQ